MEPMTMLHHLKFIFVAIIFFLCLLLSFPIHSKAENQSSELAMALVKVNGVEASLEKVARLIVKQHKATVRDRHPNMTSSGLEKYATYLLEELLKQKEDLIQNIAGLYPRYFTEEEMQHLFEFYQTPLGKKFVKTQSHMQDAIVPLTFEWGTKAVKGAAARVHARLKEEGIEL